MPEPFKLEKEEFLEGEWRWTYALLFTFYLNKKKIEKITITDHFQQKPGRKKITKELILSILQEKLNNKTIRPSDYLGNRIVFVRNRVGYQGKKYKIVFWFENNNPNWLWIRTCHQQD